MKCFVWPLPIFTDLKPHLVRVKSLDRTDLCTRVSLRLQEELGISLQACVTCEGNIRDRETCFWLGNLLEERVMKEDRMSMLGALSPEEMFCDDTQATPESTALFSTLYQDTWPLIYRYVYRRVGHREDAEDLTAQIFLKAVSQMQLEREARAQQNWLYEVARTTLVDHWRTLARRLLPLSLEALQEAGWEKPAEGTGQTTGESHAPERVQQVLEPLSERYREVLTCRFLLQLTVRETAQKMGVSEAVVKVSQSRALKRATCLDECSKGRREKR